MGGGKIGFEEAERRYAELKRQLDAGTIGVDDFDAQRQWLMAQDSEGRWWAKSPNNDEWHYYDGSAWVPGTPPGYEEVTGSAWVSDTSPDNQEAIPGAISSSAQTLSPQRTQGVEKGENGRQRVPPWILTAGLGGIMLVGILLVLWALVLFLRGEPELGKQSVLMGSEQSNPMKSQQEESALGKVAFDSAFIHSATSENILENSTYLDNPLTNDKPNALLYVTPTWNPGGRGSTYNDHPIGVWYDTKRQRWAIYNQDKASMPNGAAFNVAVLAEPPKAT